MLARAVDVAGEPRRSGGRLATTLVATILARAVDVAGEPRRSGDQLATMLVATIFIIIFFFPFFFSPPLSPFLIEGVLGSKNLFSESGSKWPIT